MKTRTLANGLSVSALGLGCMGMSEFYGAGDDAESLRVLHRAAELGATFFDTADTYGLGKSEELLGRFLKETDKNICLATKFGIVRAPGQYERVIDNSPQYARAACEASLTRLGIECIDLYYVHRIDTSRPIEEVMEVLSALVAEGKIRHIGLSEVSATTLRRAHAIHPVSAVQTEYSLWTREVEQTVLPACRELGVGFVPYSPLGRGFLTGTITAQSDFTESDVRPHLPRFAEKNLNANLAIVDAVQSLAKAKQHTPAQISLAWLLSKGENIVPIPGTRRISYLEENIAAVNVTLTPAEITSLEQSIDDIGVAGARYTEEGLKGVNA